MDLVVFGNLDRFDVDLILVVARVRNIFGYISRQSSRVIVNNILSYQRSILSELVII
jgi:hypothetical protein